jgi:hypothetical protein
MAALIALGDIFPVDEIVDKGLEIIGPTIAVVYLKVCSRTSMVKIGSAIRLE